jgi:hypothetical protein
LRALKGNLRLLRITDPLPSGQHDPASPGHDASDQVDAHLIQPFSEVELLHTIGELLGEPVRRTPRLDVELLARLERDERREPRSMLGNVVRLSGGGALVECQEPLELGEKIELQFVLPGSTRPLRLRGDVANAEELELRYAVAFEADAEDRQQVAIFIDLQVYARAQASPLPKSRHRWTSSEST